MENFGEGLLAQRAERERSLQELESYKKRLEQNGVTPSHPPKERKGEAEALLATFSHPPDLDYDDEDSGMVAALEETDGGADSVEDLDDAIEVDFDEAAPASPVAGTRRKSSKPPKKLPSEPPDRPSLWEPDLPNRGFGSAAWIAAGMAAALAAAALVFYFYFY